MRTTIGVRKTSGETMIAELMVAAFALVGVVNTAKAGCRRLREMNNQCPSCGLEVDLNSLTDLGYCEGCGQWYPESMFGDEDD